MIRHIVMWKFREDADPTEFLTRLAALQGEIDWIRSMEIHRSAVADAAYDAVLISDFDTLEDVERYKKDPRHVAVSDLYKTIRITRSAIDIEL
ncbi:MAG: Dabb family protein [Oscillospiraceae bacterium]|nr:Dabb family protein [Oscillospiraceae bacterium]